MKLSAPIYRLKRQARLLSRNDDIPLHQALDRTAQQEGFQSWSLLANHAPTQQPGKALVAKLRPGDLVLLAARPGQGKTRLGLELAIEAMKAGRHGAFFTLEYNASDIVKSFSALGETPTTFHDRFDFDNSDDINADHIIDRLMSAPRGTVVVIDYLQLLDQKRTNPDLMEQVKTLKAFAKQRGVIIVFISQIHRNYDPAKRPLPELADVRLPNPLDLSLFDKACFLHAGGMSFAAVN